MKRGRVAVEDGLTNVRQELINRGFEVLNLDDENLRQADAVVIGGGDENFMNMNDAVTNIPVVDARGLSAREVHSQLARLQERNANR